MAEVIVIPASLTNEAAIIINPIISVSTTLVEENPSIIPGLVTEGGRVGPAGPPGPPGSGAGSSGITVSAIAPSNPALNDLWFVV